MNTQGTNCGPNECSRSTRLGSAAAGLIAPEMRAIRISQPRIGNAMATSANSFGARAAQWDGDGNSASERGASRLVDTNSRPLWRKRASVAISLGNGWKLLRASLRRSTSTSAAHSAAWPDRRSRKAREIRFHLVQDEQDVLRREVQALAEQSDRFVRNGGGGSCRPPAWRDYPTPHKPTRFCRSVGGAPGCYHKA